MLVRRLRVLLFAMFLCAETAFAGSADAIIKGWTGTGRTQLLLHVGDISELPRYLKFTIDGKSLEMTEKEIECQSVICDIKNKIYTVSVRSSRGEFRLWMIPASLKVLASTPHKAKWMFRAIAVGTDPRQDYPWTFSPEIELACTLEYEIGN